VGQSSEVNVRRPVSSSSFFATHFLVMVLASRCGYSFLLHDRGVSRHT
jgi:hypothetical protein